MVSRIPNPLIPASPWVHGEPLDELKLHQRIDVPLETLGGIMRTFNTDLASFYGILSPSTSVTANTLIPWIGQLDTAGGYLAPVYIPDTAGLYYVAANLAYGTGTAGSAGLIRATANTGPLTDAQAPLSHDGAVITNGGPRIGFPIYLNAGDEIGVQSTVGFSISAVGVNWWFVQQLTWG